MSITIDQERCKGCAFCVEYCPKDVLVMSERFNRKGYHTPEAIKEGECVNCSLCEMICPDYAIFSVEVPTETNSSDDARTSADGKGALVAASVTTSKENGR